MTGQQYPADRHDTRRAETRTRIAHAASHLFTERSYDDCSMKDIAVAAGIAVRTLYLHFDSKASILLAYFDDWLDAYVAALRERPADEPIDASVRISLERLIADGWENPSFSAMTTAHPTIEHIGGGSTEVAGHMLHRWSGAQTVLARHYAESGAFAPDSSAPRARAGLVFASFVGALLVMRDAFDGDVIDPGASGYSVGVELITEMNRGSI